MALYKLKGVVQPYAWGGSDFISKLIGRTESAPAAEYWMGAHDKGAAIVQSKGQTLKQLIDADPVGMLGNTVAEHFKRLPFLFKVLDVNDMLSIQVHPSKSEAVKGFARENELGIPLDASHRSYKDDNHKPEIMVALSNFWLLHGFKNQHKMMETLANTDELKHLLPVFNQYGYHGLYAEVMRESQEITNRVLRPLINRIQTDFQNGDLPKSSPEYWAAKAFRSFCTEDRIDKGIYSIFFFNIVHLKAGEGIFQDAGIPHAYLQGQNMELMANSDNVLRGGLTPKHVDVEELLNQVVFEATEPNVLKGRNFGASEVTYDSPAADFELSMLDLDSQESYHQTSSTLEIMIILEGATEVTAPSENLLLEKGEVFAVSAGTAYQIKASRSSVLYKAKCPVDA
ncbi:MAG: mannose-6-phosphate isomerase, class I [Bacteroidota bacterium]